jgi:uncharacterized protein (UPF0332 family)
MKKSPEQEYIDYRINTAKDALDAAQILAKEGHWNSVINRLYYACFYAVSALLYARDLHTHTHSGVKHQFTLNFIKPGLIDKKETRIYLDLFDYRLEADYVDFADFDEKTTLPLITPVEEFLKKIENLIIEK